MSEPIATMLSESPDAVRDEVLDALRLATNADATVWHDVTESGLLAVVRSRGAPEPARIIASHLGKPLPTGSMTTDSEDVRRLRRGGWTLERPIAASRSAFQGMYDVYRSVEALESLPVFQLFYARARITDQLRLLAYRGNRFIGWIGALRTHGRFSVAERRRANALVRRTVEGLAAARTLEALDEDPFLLFDGAGVVERGTERAPAWLTAERAQVFRRWITGVRHGVDARARIDGVSARLVRLSGGDGVRYLAMLRQRDAIELRATAILSPTERAVAEDLAAGLTLREVAALRGFAESTAKTHAKHVYRKLGVASRIELVDALRREK
jgi:DNA-binding CsgD family transcriptional regulator